jgi:protein SCO1/2
MLAKKNFITLIVVTTGLFIAFTAYAFFRAIKPASLPVLGQVQDFQLFDEDGREFSLKELEGDIWIANFFFTTCGDICPMMTKHMAALHRSFALLEGVTLVSVTVNPEFDSADVLKQYAKKYHADTRKWHFLTGTREQITDLAVKSFKLGSVDEPVFHSAKFALVDRRGLIRGYYDGVQSGEIAQLFKDVSSVLKEN